MGMQPLRDLPSFNALLLSFSIFCQFCQGSHITVESTDQLALTKKQSYISDFNPTATTAPPPLAADNRLVQHLQSSVCTLYGPL